MLENRGCNQAMDIVASSRFGQSVTVVLDPDFKEQAIASLRAGVWVCVKSMRHLSEPAACGLNLSLGADGERPLERIVRVVFRASNNIAIIREELLADEEATRKSLMEPRKPKPNRPGGGWLLIERHVSDRIFLTTYESCTDEDIINALIDGVEIRASDMSIGHYSRNATRLTPEGWVLDLLVSVGPGLLVKVVDTEVMNTEISKAYA